MQQLNERPGDLFFTAPSDLEALEKAVGKPIDLDQSQLETCVRVNDQHVGSLASGSDPQGLHGTP